MSNTAEPRRLPDAPPLTLLAAAQDFWSSFLSEPRGESWSPADLLSPYAPFPSFEDPPSISDGFRLAATVLRFTLAEYNYVQTLAGGWAAGWNEFIADYLRRGLTEPSVPLHKSMHRWQETVEHRLQRTLRSKHYLDAQSELIRRFADLLLERRRLSEFAAGLFGIPTERGLDEAYRRIHELKREVRTLKREVSALKSAEQMKARNYDNGQAQLGSGNSVDR
jgi:hypothetical protein